MEGKTPKGIQLCYDLLELGEAIEKNIQSSHRKEYPDRRSPTLQTVLMVEKFIEKNSGKYKRTQLRKRLPEKVIRSTFQFILDYLEGMHKITYDTKGYIISVKS
jgi:hypothetical protein